MKEITIKLTVEEANQVLVALADQPYRAVNQLIANIHQQANQQMEQKDGDQESN